MELLGRLRIPLGGAGSLMALLLLWGCRPVTGGAPQPAPAGQPSPRPQDQVTALQPPRPASLASQNAQAQINLRSQPSLEADVVAQGRSGETMQLLSLKQADGGYTWYYGQLQGGQKGWVRGDLLKLEPAPAGVGTAPVPPGSALSCGADLQEARFETPSFTIDICNAQGNLRYLSTNKTTRAGIVIQTVIHNQGTYIAIDGDRQYHINNQSLGVYQVNNGNYSQLAAEKVLKSP